MSVNYSEVPWMSSLSRNTLDAAGKNQPVRIGLVQINNSFSGQNYLPYSIALLQTYVQKFSPQPGRYRFLTPLYKRVRIAGGRAFTPGWHLAIDLRNMMLVSECIAKAALERTESRGGHTRDDHPSMESDWRNTLLVCRTDGDPVPTDFHLHPRSTLLCANEPGVPCNGMCSATAVLCTCCRAGWAPVNADPLPPTARPPLEDVVRWAA